MTFTKIAVVGGLVLLGFVCWLAASGFGAAREGLISFFVLVALVGGGNLLAGRAGPYGRRRAVPAAHEAAGEAARPAPEGDPRSSAHGDASSAS
jgi:hypothetical protein